MRQRPQFGTGKLEWKRRKARIPGEPSDLKPRTQSSRPKTCVTVWSCPVFMDTLL